MLTKRTLFNVELFAAIIHPFMKTARAQGFALGRSFAPQFTKLSQIRRAISFVHGRTLHN